MRAETDFLIVAIASFDPIAACRSLGNHVRLHNFCCAIEQYARRFDVSMGREKGGATTFETNSRHLSDPFGGPANQTFQC